jgi:hypothetical protein
VPDKITEAERKLWAELAEISGFHPREKQTQ